MKLKNATSVTTTMKKVCIGWLLEIFYLVRVDETLVGREWTFFFLEGEAVGIYLGGFFSGGRNEQKFGY